MNWFELLKAKRLPQIHYSNWDLLKFYNRNILAYLILYNDHPYEICRNLGL